MKTLKTHELIANRCLDRRLYHESGEVLHEVGEELTPLHIKLLMDCGISKVIVLDDSDNISKFINDCRHKSIPLTELVSGNALSQPLFSEDGVLLLREGMVLTKEVVETLRQRKICSVRVRKSETERNLEQVWCYRKALKAASFFLKPHTSFIVEERTISNPVTLSPENVDRLVSPSSVLVEPTGTPLKSLFRRSTQFQPREEYEKRIFSDLYEGVRERTCEMFDALRNGRGVDGRAAEIVARRLVDGILQDKELLLTLSNIKKRDGYLEQHSLNVTILSIAIATALGYNEYQVLEIAYGALLHDIGMLKVSKEIVEKPALLTRSERLEVHRHPIHGLNLLQRMRRIPSETPFIVYQTHERLDGSGYPKKRKGRLIHNYAKIIAVADIFEALSSPRPYRGSYLPYEAMKIVLQLVNRGKLNADVVRAFLRYMSVFPVGSCVELSDGRVGRVVLANDEWFTKPVVRILFDQGVKLSKPETCDLLHRSDVEVKKPLPVGVFSTDVMEGF